MPGRELLSSVRRHGARSVVALLCALALLVLSAVLAAPAGASGTDHAQLSMTGLVDGDNPTGGSSLAVKPNTTISFTASAAPTQKIKDLLGSIGLGSLLDGLLGNVTFQVKADFSGLPGGHRNTVLSGNKSVSFHFSSLGTYHFTYEAQKVSINLLGQKTIGSLDLNGNQAKALGVELNASNEYVGEIDVTNNPHGGISVQLPKTQVHPKVLGHQLPKLGLPGVTTPKIGNPVGSLINPKGGKGGTTTNPVQGGSPGPGGTLVTRNLELPVPTQVMGSIGSGGSGDAGSYYGSGSGGYYGAAFPDTSGGTGSTPQGTAGGGSGSGKTTVQAAEENTPAQHQAELAANRAPSAELPVVLAILAIVALSLVTATYARLFLLRRSS